MLTNNEIRYVVKTVTYNVVKVYVHESIKLKLPLLNSEKNNVDIIKYKNIAFKNEFFIQIDEGENVNNRLIKFNSAYQSVAVPLSTITLFKFKDSIIDFIEEL